MIQNSLAFRPQERDACPQVDYVYLVDRPIATIQPSNGKMYFLHDDRFGTPQRATDNTQAVAWSANYQPFGYTSTGTGLIVQNLRLPGQEFEVETSWNHNGFRDYVPTLGRYLEPDPIGIHTLASGTGDYMYARNSPINFVDPQGLFPIDWEKLLKAIALGIGTVAPNYLTSPPPPADPTPIVRPIQSPDPLDALRELAGKDAEVLEKLGSAGEAQEKLLEELAKHAPQGPRTFCAIGGQAGRAAGAGGVVAQPAAIAFLSALLVALLPTPAY